jgi:hypothetical protein
MEKEVVTEDEIRKTKLGEKVYVYETAEWDEKGERLDGIALHCQYWERPNGKKYLCFLTPPDRGHSIEGKFPEETPDGFTFISEGFAPGEWTFKELTIESLRGEYAERDALIVGGEEIGKAFNTTQELYDWYNKEFP